MTRAVMQLERLVVTIGRLAGSPDEQRAYLTGLGVEGLTDELALEFDDALRPVLAQLDSLGVSAGVVTKIEALASRLSAMSGADQGWLWRPEALGSSAWSRVRELAAEIIDLLSRRDVTPGCQNYRGRCGERRDASLSGGRTAFWNDGTIVIRNPGAADGGTALRPTDGYDYFVGLY